MTVQRDTANTYCVLNSTVPPLLASVLESIAALMVLVLLGPQYDLAMATLPLGGSLIFGTQKDIVTECVKILRQIKNMFCHTPCSSKPKKNHDSIALGKPIKRDEQVIPTVSREFLLSDSSSQVV
ncbi:hypothetical protein K435DRAFT_813745 [Dendrothele bispora CBS 962.96]|uniref:Uncharacterized protein n=1 Tax=Dendrothele bispora (strain CBS 962.96) TaxID=1314807 RepID=A0A4S8KLL8_DENBC|nr:hypothetical protein K435DRAFT_813745 [Dendrothele bispora CBS 962.96]